MIVTRAQFADYFIETHLRDRNADLVESATHPLWVPEQVYKVRYEYFVMTAPVEVGEEYWDWCDNAAVETACFSTDDYSEEWWGFTTEQSAVLWSLRWAQ